MTVEPLDKSAKPKDAAPAKAPDHPASQASVDDQRSAAQKEKARIEQTAGQHLQPVKIEGHDQPAQPKPGDDKAGQTKPGQDKPGQDKPGPDKARTPDDKASPAQPAKPVDQADMEHTAEAIRKATGNDNYIARWADKDAINNLLKDKSEAERAAIEKIYETKYHVTLDKEMSFLTGADRDKFENILHRKDGDVNSQDVGRVHAALLEHQNTFFGRSSDVLDKDIRDSISGKRADEIQKMDTEYRAKYGCSMRDAIMKDPKVSDETKKMVDIYLKGVDKRTDADTLTLAHDTLQAKDEKAFEEVMKNASDSARKSFKDQNGDQQIKDAFGADHGLGTTVMSALIPGYGIKVALDESHADKAVQHALDVAQDGKISAATQIADNTGVIKWTTNDKGVDTAIASMTDDERARYQAGKKLASGEAATGNMTEQQKQDAKTYYEKMHSAMTSAGNATAVAKWEDQIEHKGGTLVTTLAANGGTFFNSSSGDIAHEIENMSKSDWERLKPGSATYDPDYRKQIDSMLQSYNCDAETIKRCNDILDAKQKAVSFEESQVTGHSSLLDNLSDNQHWYKDDTHAMLESISKMTPAEQDRYRTDEQYRKQVDTKINDLLGASSDAGADRPELLQAAQGMLSQVAKGEKPNYDIVSNLEGYGTDFLPDHKKAIGDIESALKDDKLRARLNNPKTPEDKAYAARFESAARKALGDSDYDKYVTPVLKTGHLDIDTKLQLDKGFFHNDHAGALQDITTASPDELKRLRDDPAYREKVIGFLPSEDQKIAQNVIDQGSIKPEDDIRQNVEHWGGSSDIMDKLRAVKDNPAELDLMKSEYSRKYGSDMEADLIGKLSGDDKQEALRILHDHETVEEKYNDSRDQYYKSRDGFGSNLVEYVGQSGTGYQLDDAMGSYQAEVAAAHKNFTEVTPEQQKQLEEHFQDTLKNFKESKSAAADAVVNGAVAGAAIASLIVTGGADAPLLLAMAAGGAAMKVGAKAAIMGGDYDTDAYSVTMDCAAGAVNGVTSLLGPGECAALFKVGEKAALEAASITTRELAEQGAAGLLKEGGEETLQKGTAAIMQHTLSSGAKKVAPEQITALAERTVSKELTGEAREQAVQQLSQTLSKNLDSQLQKETATWLTSVGREAALNAGGGALGGGAAGTFDGVAKWDPKKSVGENLANVAESASLSALTGGAMGGGMTMAMKGLGHGIAESQRFFKAPESVPVIERPSVMDGALGSAADAGAPKTNPSIDVLQVAAAEGGVSALPGVAVTETVKPVELPGAQGQPATNTPEVVQPNNASKPNNPSAANSPAQPNDASKKTNAPHAGDEPPALPRTPVSSKQASDRFEYSPLEPAPAASPRGLGLALGDMPFDGGKTLIYTPNQARQGILTGDRVIYNGESYKMAGVEPSGKYSILAAQGELPAPVVKSIPRNDFYNQYEHIERTNYDQQQLYYCRDRNGNVFTANQEADGNIRVESVPKFKAVPNAEVRLPPVNGPQDVVFAVNGKPAHIENGSFEVGRTITDRSGGNPINNTKVSGRHGQVQWDRNDEKFYYQDLGSTNGSEIRVAGSDTWRPVPKGSKVEFKQGDEIRLAGQNDSIIKMSGKPPKEFPSRDDVQIYVDNKPVTMRDNTLPIGRSERTDGQAMVAKNTVSSRHGALRYDPDEGAFFYCDSSSTNGSYLKRAGERDFTYLQPNQEVRVGPTDQIRLGGDGGPEVRLVPFDDTRVGPITQSKDLQVAIDGKNIDLKNGPVEIGRSHDIGDSGSSMTDLRVSRNHGTLRWDEGQKSLVYSDHSSAGTYIKRDGTNTWEKLKNQETRIGVNDEVHFGSPDGPQLQLADARTSSSVQDSQAFFGGAPLDISAGSVEIGRAHQAFSNGQNDALNKLVSNDHGTLKWNQKENSFYYTDHSVNGTYIQRAGSKSFVRLPSGEPIKIGQYDQLRLGGDAGPELKLNQTRGQRLDDGRIRFNRPDGSLIRNPDGSEVFSDGAGVRLERNPSGQIKSATDPAGFRTDFSYDSAGNLNRVDYTSGENWRKIDNHRWEITQPDGSKKVSAADISVEQNGGLRFKDRAGDVIENVNGSVELHKPNGRIEYTSARLDFEQHRLNALADRNFPNIDQKHRFNQLVSDFQTRARQQGLSQNDIALTYHQVNRLMLAGADAPLSLGERMRLSEQILHESAYPTQIDQGRNPTCNVATVENRMFTREPDKAARLIADVATTGKYITADGTLIDLTRVPGGLHPDTEALGGMANSFQRGGMRDVKVDGQRNWAGQIFEQTAANVKWARTPELRMQPGDVLMYTKPEGREAARLMKYSPDSSGRMVATQIDNAPKIYSPELTDIYNQITGGNDRDFVIVGPGRSTGLSGQARSVNSAADFENALRDIRDKKNLPAIVMVDARNEPFKKWINTDGNTNAWHVVNVQNITTDMRTGKMMVEVSNQWGEQANHLGDQAIPADVLFNATRESNGVRMQNYSRSAASSPARPADVGNERYRFDEPAPEGAAAIKEGDATAAGAQGDGTIRDVNEQSAPERMKLRPEDTLDPARIKQVSAEISQRMQDKPMTGEQFSEMFAKMTPEDRQIATELLEHSAGNMNSRALDGQLVDLAKKMNPHESVTVYTLSGDTSGNPLAYLFRKNNPNLNVDIKILDPSAMESLNNNGYQSLVFDDLSKATPEQRAFLAKQTDLTVANLGGFDKGMNLWDFGATKYAGPQLMESKLADLTKEVKAAMLADPSLTLEAAIEKTSNEQALAAAKEINPEAKIVRPDFDSNRELRAEVLDTEKERIDDLYREFTEPLISQQQIADFLGGMNARQQASAAIILRDGAVVNTYSTMMDQMRNVQNNILKETGKRAEDLIVVTSFDKDGSAYLVNSLYGKVNGLKPSQYMSLADVRAAGKGSLNGKVLVYLDDISYSGKQAFDAVADNATAFKQTGAKVAVGTLGSFQVPESKNYWTQYQRNTAERYQQVKRLAPTVVTDTSYPTFYSPTNSSMIDAFGSDPALLQQTGGKADWSKSSVDAAVVLPYGGPNNNIELLNQLLREAGMPGSK